LRIWRQKGDKIPQSPFLLALMLAIKDYINNKGAPVCDLLK
jgi:hypothetical protein